MLSFSQFVRINHLGINEETMPRPGRVPLDRIHKIRGADPENDWEYKKEAGRGGYQSASFGPHQFDSREHFNRAYDLASQNIKHLSGDELKRVGGFTGGGPLALMEHFLMRLRASRGILIWPVETSIESLIISLGLAGE